MNLSYRQFATVLLILSGCGGAQASVSHGIEVDPGQPPDHIIQFFSAIPANQPSDIMSYTGQVYMQMLPAVGREDRHSMVLNWPIGPEPCDTSTIYREDVIEEIRTHASKTRLVIMNEAHDSPKHREFIRQVALNIRDVGYDVYAAETFSDNVSQGPHPSYARVQDGYYSNEPVFGRLIRDVKAAGFRLVSYEHRTDGATDEVSTYQRTVIREEGQATNIANVLKGMSDKQRLFVHVGYSHASEVPIPFEGKTLAWMAKRLKDKTGIDPLTIDQTKCISDSGTVSFAEAGRRHVPAQFDLIVGHPPIKFESGRPDWRIHEGISQIEVPGGLLSDEERVIVEARYDDEPIDAVPIDRIMLWPGESLPLLLAPGRYVLVSYFEESDRQATINITVNP